MRAFAFAALLVGAFAKFARFALREILAFIGLLAQKLARFFARLRREQNPNKGSNAQTYKEIRYF